ncbi:hypothetical protein Barb4_04511 [Bacteroidales bacterium Barb4]|nr:hypothetical protein Barb4_04511 [Bacteroidales bacterium Barb4]
MFGGKDREVGEGPFDRSEEPESLGLSPQSFVSSPQCFVSNYGGLGEKPKRFVSKE